MSEERDIPEPEHDHLLDHEFHDDESWEEDAQAIVDEEDDDDDFLDQIDQDD
jgi:hypothetical protein